MDLSSILRCPRCHRTFAAHPEGYDCAACGVRYPIVAGIPSFVPSDARPLPSDAGTPDARPSRARVAS